MDTFENDSVKMWIAEGILHCVYTAEHFDAIMIEEGIKGRLLICADKTYPMFSDITKLKSVTREGRQRMAQKDAGIGISVVAILTNSKVQKVIYNFFNTIYKAPVPGKMFNNKDEAMNWLQQYVNQAEK